MRDPNRIDKFLKVLGDNWKKVPDWRFGQLVENIMDYTKRDGYTDLFFIEDDDFEYYIEKFFGDSDE